MPWAYGCPHVTVTSRAPFAPPPHCRVCNGPMKGVAYNISVGSADLAPVPKQPTRPSTWWRLFNRASDAIARVTGWRVSVYRVRPAGPPPLNVPPRWRLETRARSLKGAGLARFVRETPPPVLTLDALRAHYGPGARKGTAPHSDQCRCFECWEYGEPPTSTLSAAIRRSRLPWWRPARWKRA